MSNLPNELIIKILKHLNYDQLLIVKQVDEHFKDLAEYVISVNVVIVSENYDSLIYRMHGDNDILYLNKCLISNSIFVFKSQIDMHQSIKKLLLINTSLLPLFDELCNLVHLEIIRSTTTKKLGKCLFLRLAKLEKLKVQLVKLSICLVLDCPKLKDLSSNVPPCDIKLMYPKSLEILDCIVNDSLKQFENLKILSCATFDFRHKSNILSLKHLKEFYFYDCDSSEDICNFIENCNSVKIYMHGIHLNNPFQECPLRFSRIKQINSHSLDYNSLDVYLENIHLTTSILKQNELTLSIFDSFDLQLIRKMKYVNKLHVRNDNRNGLRRSNWKELLKASTLHSIRIDCPINQKLLNMLPTYCHKTLVALELSHFEKLDFIFYLRNLKTLHVQAFFDFDLFKELMRKHSLKYIRIIDRIDPHSQKALAHEVRIDGDVECIVARKVILRQSIDDFKCTIEILDSWSQLFDSELC